MNVQTSLNMNRNEIQNAVIQSLSIEPVNPKEGQIYYDNKTKATYQYNGTNWMKFGLDGSTPITPKSDLNTYIKEGIYYIGADGINITNTPFSTNSFSLIVVKNASYVGGVSQIFIDYQTPKAYIRNYTNQPLKWTQWTGFMTNQRPSDVPIELAPEWQNRHGGTFCNIEENGKITVTIGAGTVKPEGVTGTSLLGTLPEGYRPNKTFYFPCVSSYQAITGYITNNGSIGILTQTPITVVYGQFSFYI